MVILQMVMVLFCLFKFQLQHHVTENSYIRAYRCLLTLMSRKCFLFLNLLLYLYITCICCQPFSLYLQLPTYDVQSAAAGKHTSMCWYKSEYTCAANANMRWQRYTSVLLIIIYRAWWRGAKCCYRGLAAMFSSQKPSTPSCKHH